MTTVHYDFDDTEVRRLEVDLSQAPARIQREAPRVLRRLVGPKLAHEMKQDADGHRYLTHLPSHVSYEMLGPFSLEAGIEYVGQGKLAHIIVFGSVNNAPVYDHVRGLRRTTPYAEKWLGDAAEESVLGEQ